MTNTNQNADEILHVLSSLPIEHVEKDKIVSSIGNLTDHEIESAVNQISRANDLINELFQNDVAAKEAPIGESSYAVRHARIRGSRHILSRREAVAVSGTTVKRLDLLVDELTVLEAAELAKLLEEKWGVSAAAPVAVASAEVPDGSGDKEEYRIILSATGDKKINVIKEVRTITGLGLKEARALVEGSLKPLKEGVNKEEAEEIAQKLRDAGASVEIE